MRKDWKYGILDDAVDNGSSNISLNKIKDEEGDYPVYGAQGIVANVSFFQQSKDYLAIIKDGAGIGRISKHPKKSSILGTMQYIIPKEGYDIDFVKYFLSSIDFEKHRNGSTIPHIYYKDYKTEPFPILPLPEQKRIVSILDKTFAAIAKAKTNAEQNLNNAKELFESYLHNIFESEKEGYKKTTLSQIVNEMMTGPFGSMLHKSDYVENGIPVINPQNIVDNSIIPLHKTMISEVTFNKLKKYALIENDIIMARRGEMGRCAIVRKENVNWLCGTGSLVIRGDKNKVNTEYLNLYLSSSNIKEQLERASIGATMNNLNQKVLGNLKLRLPSLKEQEFVIQNMQILSNATKKLQNNYQKKLDELEELKKSILHKAFNGEL